MTQTGDAAEQVVSMATNLTVKGIEVATNLAGKAALSLATFLIAALKDQKRTKGKTRMQAFNGKPTKVFVIKTSELRRFAEEARKYGVLYEAISSLNAHLDKMSFGPEIAKEQPKKTKKRDDPER